MAAPYRVASPLPTAAELDMFLAEDAAGARAWVHQSADRSPGADERMLAAATRCMRLLPDLVQVLDVGRDPTTRAWVATAPIEGSTLTQLIADHAPLDVALVVRVCARLAELLDAAAPLGLFPALPADAVYVAGTQVQLIGFSPAPGPRAGREQAREIGALLDAALPREGRRADVAAVVRRCLEAGPEAFEKTAELAAALHALVGGDTRPSSTAGLTAKTMPGREGEILGTYQLVSKLGEGGMGDVYLARHTRLGREVALKLLKAELASDADVVRRFFQEARVVNEINHPHIVEVIDFVEEPPHVFCVMEHLKGSTLGDLAINAPLSLERVARLLQQTCEALHAAHTHGVVHRDVKPANIFVCQRNGQDFVKLLDFGIARLLRTAAKGNTTQVGLVIGTPAYMSPEQAQGRAVDARTDIYAVGAVLFELLSGEPLSTSMSPRLPEKALRGEAIPRALSDLVSRCISMEPSQRPATALEVSEALKGICEPPRPETTQRAMAAAGLAPAASSRRPLKWAVGAVAVGVLGLGSFFAMRPSEPVAPVLPVAVLVAEVDAGAVAVAVVEPVAVPPIVAPAEPVPVVTPVKKKGGRPARDPLAARFAPMKKNYASLVAKHGAAQLTSLERARVGQSMEDYAASDFKSLASTLAEAEQALKVASQRLGP